jgi:predicted hydrocarbon binding protein
VNIRAQGLLNAAKLIETRYGQSALRDVIRACHADVRERYITATPLQWHPMRELVDLLEVAERKLGKGDGAVAEEIGAAGARANMSGVFARLVTYITRPEFLMKRVVMLWRQYNDEGEMRLVVFDQHSLTVEVSGVPDPSWLFCCTLTGWCREILATMGAESPVARHVECRARGGNHCLWNVWWKNPLTEIAQKQQG